MIRLKYQFVRFPILTTLAFSILCYLGTSTAYSYENSPRINALGGAGLNIIDEEAFYHNPGTLGILHLDKYVTLSVPLRNHINYTESNFSCNSGFGFSTGFSLNKLFGSNINDLDIGLSFGYVYDKSEHEGQSGGYDPPGPFYYKDIYGHKRYIFGASLKYSNIRFGLGYSAINYEAEHNLNDQLVSLYESDYQDLGIYMDASFGLGELKSFGRSANLVLTPSFAFVRKNLNAENTYPTNLIGFGLLLAGQRGNFNDYSIGAYLEISRFNSHTPIKVGSSLYWSNRIGVEIGIADAVFVRFGKKYNVDNIYFGAGISGKKLISILLDNDNEKSFWNYLARNIDIKYNISFDPMYDERLTTHNITISI